MLATNIDEILVALAEITDRYVDEGSPLALFPAIYERITEEVRRGIELGRFEDGPRMERLDTIFANRYLQAVYDHRAGRPTTRAWRAVFSAERRDDTMSLQHVLLGMNAHINLDLAIATAQTSPGAPIGALQADFMEINTILTAMLDGVEDTLGEHSPLLSLLDRLGGRADEAVIGFSIKRARHEAWFEAVRLAGTTPDRQAMAIKLLDRKVGFLGQVITGPGPLLRAAIRLIGAEEGRDVRPVVAAIRRIQAV